MFEQCFAKISAQVMEFVILRPGPVCVKHFGCPIFSTFGALDKPIVVCVIENKMYFRIDFEVVELYCRLVHLVRRNWCLSWFSINIWLLLGIDMYV